VRAAFDGSAHRERRRSRRMHSARPKGELAHSAFDGPPRRPRRPRVST
jgi:hypothetical protein